ncbi:MAG: hypothetical protein SP1CHLAM9_01100 [Chlamydiia bacterium]|nr:hypothetical protein [Chlamydiia bacterium]
MPTISHSTSSSSINTVSSDSDRAYRPLGRHRRKSSPSPTIEVQKPTSTTKSITKVALSAALSNADKKVHLNEKIEIQKAKIRKLEKRLARYKSRPEKSDKLSKLEQRIQKTHVKVAAHEQTLSKLNATIEQRIEKGLPAIADIPVVPLEEEVVKKEKSIYSTVRFFTEFKDQTPLMQVIQVIFSVAILAVRLLVDGLVFITNTYVDGVLEGKIRNGTLTKLVVKTGVDTLSDPELVQTIIDTGEKLIESLGDKASVVIVALLRNKATLSAIEDALSRLIKNPDIEQGIAGLIGSEKIKTAVRGFIQDQGETLTGVAKRALTDKELEALIICFLRKLLGDSATGMAIRVADNVTLGVGGKLVQGAGAVKDAAGSAASRLRSGAGAIRSTATQFVRNRLGLISPPSETATSRPSGEA